MSRTWYIPFLSRYVVKKKVNCLTLMSMLSRTKYKHIDFIVIDTEGYDFQILKQIDFTKVRPAFILFEHLHISKKEKISAWKILEQNNYQIEFDYKNTFASLK